MDDGMEELPRRRDALALSWCVYLQFGIPTLTIPARIIDHLKHGNEDGPSTKNDIG